MANGSWCSFFLDTVGDGSGNKNANVDGSVTPVEFKFNGIAEHTIHIKRLIAQIRDTQALRAEQYGNLVELTNGLLLEFVWHGKAYDLLDGEPIKNNAHWGRHCYDAKDASFGAGDNFMLVRWTFDKAGIDLRLDQPTDEIRLTVQDDLTGLIDHTFLLQGTSYYKDSKSSSDSRVDGTDEP